MQHILPLLAAAGLAVPAAAQSLPAAPAQVEPAQGDPATSTSPLAQQLTPAQVEQVVATLRERNAQLVKANEALATQTQRAAEFEAKANEATALREALKTAAARNRELVAIGLKIIRDYENLGLGRRVAAREPLTQLYRVQLENKLQQFESEIAGQRVFIDAVPAVPANPATAPTPAE